VPNSPPDAPAASGPEATAELWRRRPRGVPALAAATALTGIDLARLADATAIALAASPEARTLLDGMELRIRTLTTTVRTRVERCIHEVRGPIRWSETITARANALGNEDVFVCSSASRSFDTAENRALVGALEEVARAGRAMQGPVGALLDPLTRRRVERVAADAAAWRADRRLAGVRAVRLDARERARLRSGHRLARLGPVLAISARVAEPFESEDVAGLCDQATHGYHATVLDVAEHSTNEPWRQVEGHWCAGPVTFRHPNLVDGTGLRLDGRAVVPHDDRIDRAPWRDAAGGNEAIRWRAGSGPAEVV
jgi:hypothetical protein